MAKLMVAALVLVLAPAAAGTGAQCAGSPDKVVLACHPDLELPVLADGRAFDTYKACVERTCNTNSLNISNGVASPQGDIPRGGVAKIVCDPGYELSNSANTSASPECRDDCTFDAPASCIKRSCPTTFADPNGMARGGDQNGRNFIHFDEYVRITCNHGYMANDSSHVYNEPCKVSYTRECGADGMLSNAHIKCVPLTCPPIPDIVQGQHKIGVYSPKMPLRYRNTTAVSCQAGWRFDGDSPERECSWTCQYSSLKGKCVPETCNTTNDGVTTSWVPDPPNIFGKTSKLTCANGHVFNNTECSFEEALTCEVGGSLSKPARACTAAKCPISGLLILNGQTSSSSDQVFGGYASATCNSGYRARTAAASGLVSCADDKTLNVSCGIGSVGEGGYRPCAWNNQSTCAKVMCKYAPVDNGTASATPDDILSINGSKYMTYDSTITISCNSGYGVTAKLDDQLQYSSDGFARVPQDAPSTTEWTCDANCSHLAHRCLPKICGNYTIPPNANAVAPSRTNANKGAGHMFLGVATDESIQVTCQEHFVVHRSGVNVCENTFTVTCEGANLKVRSAAGSLVDPSDVTCVPAQCDAPDDGSEILANAVPNALKNHSYIVNGKMNSTDPAAVVECAEHYLVKPSGFAGAHPICGHDGSFTTSCNANTCTFDNSKSCAKKGCFGLVPGQNQTADGLQSVTFEDSSGVLLTDTGDGFIEWDREVTVKCPAGYRVRRAENMSHYANASWPTNSKSSCGATCTLPLVNCTRLSCGVFVLPANSQGTTQAQATYDGTTQLLYGESLNVTCAENFHFNSHSCGVRMMSLTCADDGIMAYSHGFTSQTSPSDMSCVPAECNIANVSQDNALPFPTSGSKVHGESLEVASNQP